MITIPFICLIIFSFITSARCTDQINHLYGTDFNEQEAVSSNTTALALRPKRQIGFGCCPVICCGIGGIMPPPIPIPPPMPPPVMCCAPMLPPIPPPIVSCCGCCMPVCVPMCMTRCLGMMGGCGFGRRKRAAIVARNISYPLLR